MALVRWNKAVGQNFENESQSENMRRVPSLEANIKYPIVRTIKNTNTEYSELKTNKVLSLEKNTEHPNHRMYAVYPGRKTNTEFTSKNMNRIHKCDKTVIEYSSLKTNTDYSSQNMNRLLKSKYVCRVSNYPS